MAIRKYTQKQIPERDKDLFRVLHPIADIPAAQVARHTKGKISAATIRNWRNGKVRYPRHLSMVVVLAAVGFQFVVLDEDAAKTVDQTEVIRKKTKKQAKVRSQRLLPKKKEKPNGKRKNLKKKKTDELGRLMSYRGPSVEVH